MKASQSIKKFLGRWVTVVMRTGVKITIKIKSIIETYGQHLVEYQVMGSRESRQINRSDIVDIYA